MKSLIKKPATALTRTAEPHLEDIRDWFASPLGQNVLRTEAGMLDQLLPGMFGYHLAQFSVQSEELFESSRINNKFSVQMDERPICLNECGLNESGLNEGGSNQVVASPSQLPFASDSLDVVLLHHLLDFVRSPQEVLKEAARVTLPMGKVVIIGFNPTSLWGLWRSVAQFGEKAPWTGQYIRTGRLMDWLNLLDFKIDRAQFALYGPPAKRFTEGEADYSQGVSRRLNLPVGAVYVIVAEKHIGNVRQIRPVWQQRPALGRLSVVRSIRHEGMKSVNSTTDGSPSDTK